MPVIPHTILLETHRYRLVEATVPHGERLVGIQCLTCNRTSWHPQDVAQRYCGWCHVFHEETANVPCP